METQKQTQTEPTIYYVLNIFNTHVRYASNVGIFTDIKRVHKIKQDIEKVIEVNIPDSNSLHLSITAIPEDGLNKVNAKYAHIFDKYPSMDSFEKCASEDPSSFFGWLKHQTHIFHTKRDASVETSGKDKATQTHSCNLLVVTHFSEHVKDNNVIGLFTCPLLAQRVQECILYAYGLTLADTMDSKNMIELRCFDSIDPKLVCPYYLNIRTKFT